MSKLVWDKTGEHVYETGVDHGVLFVSDGIDEATKAPKWKPGVAWNGLTSVTESPEGAEANPIYADNIKYLNILSAEDFGCTIEAYTYPDEFGVCDGSAEIATGVTVGQQPRKKFCFSYRTKVGNDLDENAGYKIHIIYNCLAAPTEKAYETVNDSPEAITFSWEVSTTPVEVAAAGIKPTAHLEIDTTKVTPAALAKLEEALYGGAEKDPKLLTPDEVIALVKAV